MKALLAALAVCSVASAASAQDAPAKRWKNTGELNFSSTSGNTKASTYGLGDLFTYAWEKTTLELNGRMLKVNSSGVTTAEQYSASEKVSWKLSDRNYLFERAGWDKNEFAGYDNRWDFSVGAGRELVKTELDLLAAELGGGFTTESRVAPPDADFASGRAYAKYERKLSATAGFSQDVEYLHNFEESEAYRLNTQTAVTASMTTHVSLKFSFNWKHVNLPPAGFGKDDTLTTAAVIVNF